LKNEWLDNLDSQNLASSLKFVLFFFFSWGVRASLRAPRLFPTALQAQEQVRHRGGDRRTHRGSNPGQERNKSHKLITTVKPSSAGYTPSSARYTRELEPGHSGRTKPAKATELQAPCVNLYFFYNTIWGLSFIQNRFVVYELK
jgi:hypothetical protein